MNFPFLNIPRVLAGKLEECAATVFYYEDWRDLIEESGKNGKLDSGIFKEILPHLGTELAPFRKQYVIGHCQLLCAVYPEERIIRIGTPRLAREVFLLNEAKHLIDQIDRPEVRQFVEHVEQMAILEPPTFPSDIQLLASRFKLPDLLTNHSVDSSVIKKKLIVEIKRYRPRLFERMTDWGLGLTAEYALFRVHLLKFLAMLPSLDYDASGVEVKKNFLESLRRLVSDSQSARKQKKTGQSAAVPKIIELSLGLLYRLAQHTPALLLRSYIHWAVRYLAKRFIAGESIEKAHHSLKKLFQSGRDATLDQLGELVVSEEEADHYCNEVIKLINGFKQHVPVGSKNKAGIRRANVSIKVSALCSTFNPAAFDYTYQRVAPRLKRILLAAKSEQVFINIDAEHIHYRDTVFTIFKKVLLDTPELIDFADCGIVLQAYLQDSYQHFLDILELAKSRNIRMPIRLVKGAYWDAETIEAEANHSPAFQFLNKEETDLMYRQLAVCILKEAKYLQLVAASHNYLDHSFVEAYRDHYCPHAPVIEHQCLDMTYEALSKGMAKLGWAVRNYVPVGSLLVGMAYLVRRIMENSSQVGVLTIMRSHRHDDVVVPPDVLHQKKLETLQLVRDLSSTKIDGEFHNVPPLRLFRQAELKQLQLSQQIFKDQWLAKDHSPSSTFDGSLLSIFSPSDQQLLVGKIKTASVNNLDAAIDMAHQAYCRGDWPKARPVERASVMMRVASLMVAQRGVLANLIVYEGGKIYSEALADIDEAIDFLNFYSREELRLHRRNPQIMSRGVMAVVAPWNFPLAIPCGMVAASLVAGNSVIFKSALRTPLIAQIMTDLFHQAGVPKDVLIHIVGSGEQLGDRLTTHPLVAGAVFTGSKEVGLHLVNNISKRLVNNSLFNITFPATAIAEMGGKNAMIVTGTADLDQAVSTIIASAFGHAGQKCSACSRVIVDARIAAKLAKRLSTAILDLPRGDSWDYSTFVNPLISEREVDRLTKCVEKAKDQGKVLCQAIPLNSPGAHFPPILIEVTAHQAQKSECFATKELFGPVIHLIPYQTEEEAIAVANATEFALTGGIISQSQDEIERLSKLFEVGNIYVNRGITGARVGIEPFGGFKLSGTGPKAGGKNYLERFHVDCAKSYEGYVVEGQRGSDYQFRCSMPSKVELTLRHRQVLHALKQVEARFESVFNGVFGSEKLLLKNFIQWVEHHYLDFRMMKSVNLSIPGQDSYNDFSQHCECSLMVSVNRIPEFSNFIYFIMALLNGAGVTVLLRNDISYKWWQRLAQILFAAGIEKTQFDYYFCTEPLMVQALKTSYLSQIILDGDQSFISAHLPLIYDSEIKQLRMKKVCTHLDRPQDGDFERYALNSLIVRSFAVNTMRHGAPLEVE